MLFFFFKQKTAYEMRISDWSSDVCSSDLPNTRFLLHQPAGGAMGTASDVAIQAKEIIRMRKRLNEIFARETGQSLERIEKDRSEERRVGKEWVSTCRSRWSPHH